MDWPTLMMGSILAVACMAAVLLPPLLHWLGRTRCVCTCEPAGTLFEAETEIPPAVFTQLSLLGFTPLGYLRARTWFVRCAWTSVHRVGVFGHAAEPIFACVYGPESRRSAEVVFVTCLSDAPEEASSVLVDFVAPDLAPTLAAHRAAGARHAAQGAQLLDHRSLATVQTACERWSERHYREYGRAGYDVLVAWFIWYAVVVGYWLLAVTQSPPSPEAIQPVALPWFLVGATIIGTAFQLLYSLNQRS